MASFRELRFLISGKADPAAFEEMAAAADASSKEIGDKMSGAYGMGATAAADAEKDIESDAEDHTSKMSELFKGLGNSLSNWGLPFGESFTSAGEKIDEADAKGHGFMQTMESVGGVAVAAGAAGLAAFAGEAVHLGMNFQQTEAQIAAASGTSVTAADKIGKAFLDTAGTTIYSGQSIATAYAGVAGQLRTTQGHALDSAQAMHVMTNAMNLAEASGQSLSSSTSAMATVMQTYGIKASGAANVSNILFNVTKDTSLGMTQVTTAVSKLHTQLGVLTPPVGQLGGLLVDLAAHGMTGRSALSAVSTSMTTLLKSATAVTTATQKEQSVLATLPPGLQKLAKAYMDGKMSGQQLENAQKKLPAVQANLLGSFISQADAVTQAKIAQKELGITVDNSKDKFVGMASVIGQLHDKIQGETQQQKLATITQVFGASAAQKMLDVVEAGPAAYNKEAAAVAKANSAHKAAEKQADTLGHELETIGAAIEDEAVKFGLWLIPKLQEVGHVTADVIRWFEKNKDAAIALGAAVAGPLALAMGIYAVSVGGKVVRAVGSGISKVTHLGSTFRDAAAGAEEQSDANDALTETLAALDKTLGLLGKSLPQTTLAWEDLADAEKAESDTNAAITEAWDQVASASETIDAALQTQAEGWQQLAAAAEESSATQREAMAAAEEAEETFGAVSEATGEESAGAFGPIGLALMAVVTVGMLVVQHWKEISHYLLDVWHGIEDAALFVWGEIKGHLKIIAEAIFVVVTGPIGLLAIEIFNHWKEIEDVTLDVWHDIESALSDAWHDIETLATDVFDDIKAFFLLQWEAIYDIFYAWPLKAADWLVTMWDRIRHDVASAWDAVIAYFKALPGKVMSALSDLGEDLLHVGEDVMAGLLHGIEDGAKDVIGEVDSVAHDILHHITDPLSVLSPSKVMYEVGENIMQGLAMGISDSAHLATDAMSAAAADLKKAAPSTKLHLYGDALDEHKIHVDERKVAQLDRTIAALDPTKLKLDKKWDTAVYNGIAASLRKAEATHDPFSGASALDKLAEAHWKSVHDAMIGDLQRQEDLARRAVDDVKKRYEDARQDEEQTKRLGKTLDGLEKTVRQSNKIRRADTHPTMAYFDVGGEKRAAKRLERMIRTGH